MFKLPFRKVKIELYIDLSTEEAQLLVNLHNKRTTSKKVFFQVSMSFMIFLWIFYFGGGVGVSDHHFLYLLFTSIINPHLLYLHLFFFDRRTELRASVTSSFSPYILLLCFFPLSHTAPPPPTTPLIFLRGNLGKILESVFNEF